MQIHDLQGSEPSAFENDRPLSHAAAYASKEATLAVAVCNASQQTSETDPCLGIHGSLIKVSGAGCLAMTVLVKTAL